MKDTPRIYEQPKVYVPAGLFVLNARGKMVYTKVQCQLTKELSLHDKGRWVDIDDVKFIDNCRRGVHTTLDLSACVSSEGEDEREDENESKLTPKFTPMFIDPFNFKTLATDGDGLNCAYGTL
jgi:hypothetical protein